jgi:hypothetical protein
VSLTLPYAFDTTDVLTLIVRGAAGLLFLVVVPGVIYSVLVSGSMGAAALLVIIAGLTLYFARLIGMHVGGAKGTITRDAVTIEATAVYGLPISRPSGTFPLRHFTAVRLEKFSGPIDVMVQGGPNEQVTLAGGDATPDVLVARAKPGAGAPLARDLAAAVALPFEERSSPY